MKSSLGPQRVCTSFSFPQQSASSEPGLFLNQRFMPRLFRLRSVFTAVDERQALSVCESDWVKVDFLLTGSYRSKWRS